MRLRCSFVTFTKHTTSYCGNKAEYLYNGTSFCDSHMIHVVLGKSYQETEEGAREEKHGGIDLDY